MLRTLHNMPQALNQNQPNTNSITDYINRLYCCACLLTLIENLPNVIINHQSQLLFLKARSDECLIINVHLASESPNPHSAPYRDAIVWQKHISRRKPIQLKMKATARIENVSSIPTAHLRR